MCATLRRAAGFERGENLMKRYLLVAGIVGALVVPAQAVAATKNYAGSVDPSGTVGFQAVVKHGHAKRIKGGLGPPAYGLLFTNVPMTCNDGQHTTSIRFAYDIAVSSNAFTTTATNGVSTVHADGVFKHHAKKAKGTFKAKGQLNGTDDGLTHTGCKTGERPWSAHQT
jgi:hypothetical protein